MCIGHINGVEWRGMGCMTNRQTERPILFDNMVLKSFEQLKKIRLILGVFLAKLRLIFKLIVSAYVYIY